MLLLFLCLLCSFVAADNCTQCLSSGKTWCVEHSTCQYFIDLKKVFGCHTLILSADNCPTIPQASYNYEDSFGRYIALPHMAASYAENPNTSCYAYTAYDPNKKSITVVFRGTQGKAQFDDEVMSLFQDKLPFFNHGHLWKYFYEAFNYLWNGGLESTVKSLKKQYPDYQLWAFGHSLGGSLATIFASYVIKTGLYRPENVRLLTFGQPRTGDRAFAMWHDNTFLYSYRVVHYLDPAPHIPFLITGTFHHRYEVFYNNNMTVGQPYEICPEADGLYCSNLHWFLNFNVTNHVRYFNETIPDWGINGCPKRISKSSLQPNPKFLPAKDKGT